MATGKITLDTGSTLNTSTYTISEDAVTKHIPRSTLNNSSGTEIGTNANPLVTSPSNGTISSIINTVTISGSTTLLGTSSVSGSVSIINTPTVTGSVSIINTPSITGSVSILNTITITGSTTLNQIVLPSASTATVNVTGATTNIIIIPSTATNSIYITDLVISNGLTAGTIILGQTNVSTAGNIKIQTLYFAANGGCVWPIVNPIKLSASTNFVATINSSGTMSIVANYYVAP